MFLLRTTASQPAALAPKIWARLVSCAVCKLGLPRLFTRAGWVSEEGFPAANQLFSTWLQGLFRWADLQGLISHGRWF